MAGGSLSPFNMNAYAIDPHPRPDGGIEAFKVDFDGFGGMFVAFGIKWVWDVNFSQVFGWPLIVFEDDAVNGIIGTANGGAGMWNQASGPGLPTWQELLDGAEYAGVSGQLAVNQRFRDVIMGFSVHDAEVATDGLGGYWRGTIMPEIQYYRDTYVAPWVDPGVPPGRVPPWVLFPPAQVGLIQSGEGVVAAQASRLTLTYGVVGTVPIP